MFVLKSGSQCGSFYSAIARFCYEQKNCPLLNGEGYKREGHECPMFQYDCFTAPYNEETQENIDLFCKVTETVLKEV